MDDTKKKVYRGQRVKYHFGTLTREHIEVGIADFDEIWHECSFQKNIRPVFFLSVIVNAQGEN